MAIETFILLMLTPQRPPCRTMIKDIAGLEAIGDMAILTNLLLKDAFRMWILVASDASRDLYWPKFSFIEMTFFAFDLGMLTG